MSHYDIVIVGNGVVGATAALCLAKKTALKVAVLEASAAKQWTDPPSHFDRRVSAISPAAKAIFDSIDAFHRMQTKRVSPYDKMFVWNDSLDQAIQFSAKDCLEEALGWIIEESVMLSSLHQLLFEKKNIDTFFSLELSSLKQTDTHIELTTATEDKITTTLLIGADGASSWVREKANLSLKIADYEQQALVATVETALPHEKTAWQRFLTTGPLAFLPLAPPHLSSIVWSGDNETIQSLLALNETDFCDELSAAFQHQLGNVLTVSSRYSFPLYRRHAEHYIADRIALIGDAAHTVHPLAGQGLNLGLLDALCLSDIIAATVKKNRDFSSKITLRKYARRRKAENTVMMAGIDALHFLFGKNNSAIKIMRNKGLEITNQWNSLKYFIAKYALGKPYTNRY